MRVEDATYMMYEYIQSSNSFVVQFRSAGIWVE